MERGEGRGVWGHALHRVEALGAATHPQVGATAFRVLHALLRLPETRREVGGNSEITDVWWRWCVDRGGGAGVGGGTLGAGSGTLSVLHALLRLPETSRGGGWVRQLLCGGVECGEEARRGRGGGVYVCGDTPWSSDTPR